MKLEIDVDKRFGPFHCSISCTLTSLSQGVFGPSGSGKSTLMNMIAGLIQPDRGSIRLDRTTLFDSAAGVNLPPEKRRVGMVFQHAHLFPHMDVQRNLLYGWKRTPREERTIDPKRVIDALHLSHLLDRRVTKLSGGERQRVALGRSILGCPRLILLDEPLTGLDMHLKYQIIPFLRQVFEEFSIPVLFTSHSLQEMRLMTDTVLIVDQGGLERVIGTEELARSRTLTGDQEYLNLLRLTHRLDLGNLLQYHWGPVLLTLLKTESAPESGNFSLSARDIVLFKSCPEASSARNILPCTVISTSCTDWLARVELDFGGPRLVAEILPQSVADLGIAPGCRLYAIFKASAMRSLS